MPRPKRNPATPGEHPFDTLRKRRQGEGRLAHVQRLAALDAGRSLILKFLQDNPGCSCGILGKELGLERGNVYNILRRLGFLSMDEARDLSLREGAPEEKDQDKARDQDQARPLELPPMPM